MLPDEITNLETPLQFFKFLFNDDLLQNICNETHKYSIQCDPNKPFPLTKNELQRFIGVCVLMSLVHLPNSRNYWNDILGNRTIIDTMSDRDFENIKHYLHFNDNNEAIPSNEAGHDRLHKIRPVIEALNETFSSVPLEESLSVDE